MREINYSRFLFNTEMLGLWSASLCPSPTVHLHITSCIFFPELFAYSCATQKHLFEAEIIYLREIEITHPTSSPLGWDIFIRIQGGKTNLSSLTTSLIKGGAGKSGAEAYLSSWLHILFSLPIFQALSFSSLLWSILSANAWSNRFACPKSAWLQSFPTDPLQAMFSESCHWNPRKMECRE